MEEYMLMSSNGTKAVKLNTLQPDLSNANKGTERGRYALEASLRKYGAGRSILVDKNGRIIAGNKTAETAGEIGIDDVILVQTDGKQIVAVQRTDLDLDDPDARALAYADNRVGQLDLDFDAEQVLADINAGIDLSTFWLPHEMDELIGQFDAPDFQEYDESVADDVEMITCPHCGEIFPK